MPSIREARSKIIDQTYRDIERGSEVRAELAAQQLGVPTADMAGLKITNLNDRRDAEIAAPSVVNDVTRQMDFVNSRGGHFGFSNDGAGHSGAVQTGSYPNVGANILTDIRERHAQVTNHTAVGDRPALEVTRPGYRRRA